jgi:hypothetical protein
MLSRAASLVYGRAGEDAERQGMLGASPSKALHARPNCKESHEGNGGGKVARAVHKRYEQTNA